jgi:hypothetical protein
VLFREEGYSPLFLNASRVKLISGFETPMQVTTSCGHDHNSLTPFSSVVVTKGHEQLIPFRRTLRNPNYIVPPAPKKKPSEPLADKPQDKASAAISAHFVR